MAVILHFVDDPSVRHGFDDQIPLDSDQLGGSLKEANTSSSGGRESSENNDAAQKTVEIFMGKPSDGASQWDDVVLTIRRLPHAKRLAELIDWLPSRIQDVEDELHRFQVDMERDIDVFEQLYESGKLKGMRDERLWERKRQLNAERDAATFSELATDPRIELLIDWMNDAIVVGSRQRRNVAEVQFREDCAAWPTALDAIWNLARDDGLRGKELWNRWSAILRSIQSTFG